MAQRNREQAVSKPKDRLVNVNLRSMTPDLREALKKLAAKQGMTLDKFCVQSLDDLVHGRLYYVGIDYASGKDRADGAPSAEDLDAVAEEQRVKTETVAPIETITAIEVVNGVPTLARTNLGNTILPIPTSPDTLDIRQAPSVTMIREVTFEEAKKITEVLPENQICRCTHKHNGKYIQGNFHYYACADVDCRCRTFRKAEVNDARS